MSLEDHMARLTAAVEKQNSLLEQVLAKTNSGEPAKSPAAAEPAKSPAATKPAAKAPETAAVDQYAITNADFFTKIKAWLESNAKGTPEGDARRAALAETLKKVGEAKVSEVTDSDKLAKLNKWFETKMKDVNLAPASEPADDEL